jgi:hypothetical protein
LRAAINHSASTNGTSVGDGCGVETALRQAMGAVTCPGEIGVGSSMGADQNLERNRERSGGWGVGAAPFFTIEQR